MAYPLHKNVEGQATVSTTYSAVLPQHTPLAHLCDQQIVTMSSKRIITRTSQRGETHDNYNEYFIKM